MIYMQLVPLKHEVVNDNVVRRCKILRFNEDNACSEAEIWFQIDRSIPLPEEDDCDAYLLSMVMEGMRENRDIEVKGSVSKELLSNLVEFQAAWNKWRPKIYNCIDISVSKEREATEKVPGAICAFSGGVDATFSVWRHTQKKYSHRSQVINLCSIVHGFDIPLSDEKAFVESKNRACKTLSDVGVNLIPIKTNYREVSAVNWEDSFSLALVATLNNFKNIAGICIIGSSEPYESLIIPWGSSPITDHLLSSSEFVVIHDGASHSRTEKIKEILEWTVGVENLRVCWQGDLKDRNCGVCEKCVRTKLNFLATKSGIPSCFPDSNILEDLKRIKLINYAILAEWRQIYNYANKNKLEGLWVSKMKKVINKSALFMSVVDHIFPKFSLRRDVAKNIVKKIVNVK